MAISRCDRCFPVGQPVVALGDGLALALRALIALDRAVGLLPGQLLGRGDDRAERDLDAGHVGAARGLGGGLHGLDLLGGLRQGLTPQAVDVGLGAAGRVRGG